MKPVLIIKEIDQENPFLWRCISCGEIKVIHYKHSQNGHFCQDCADKSSLAKLTEKEYVIVSKLEEYSGLYRNYRQRVAAHFNISKAEVARIIQRLNSRGYDLGYSPRLVVKDKNGKPVHVSLFNYQIAQKSKEFGCDINYCKSIAKALNLDLDDVYAAIACLKRKGVDIPNGEARRNNAIAYVHELQKQGVPRSTIVKRLARENRYCLETARVIVRECEAIYGAISNQSLSSKIIDELQQKKKISIAELKKVASEHGGSLSSSLRDLRMKGKIRRNDQIVELVG